MLHRNDFRHVHKLIQELFDLVDPAEAPTEGLKPALKKSLDAIEAALVRAGCESIRQRTSIIPFGYTPSETEGILDPVPVELEALARAAEYRESSSLRDVAEWVSDVTNRYISHQGLKTRLERGVYLNYGG